MSEKKKILIKNINRLLTIKFFIRYLKNRLKLIKEDDRCCGRLVIRSYYGQKPKTKRCYGMIEDYGCYNCNATNILCVGGCGNWVLKPGFCGNSCRGNYYNY